MMTIDERVDDVALRFVTDHTRIPIDSSAYRALVAGITAMVHEVIDDQRNACVRALIDVYATAQQGGIVTGDAAYRAVQNATIK